MTQSFARTLVIDKEGINYLQWPLAFANQTLDYYLDVSEAVEDEISSLQVSIAPSGTGELSISNIEVQGKTIQIGLGSGIPGRLYKVQIILNTLDGRDFSWNVNLPIQNNMPGPFQIAPDPGYGNVDTWGAIVLQNGQGFWRLENDLGNWVWG